MPQSIASYQASLLEGETRVGGFLVRIHQHQNRRYYANLTGPNYNTLVETPDTIQPESLKDFCYRVASKISSAQPSRLQTVFEGER